METCHVCGAPLREGAKFCSGCGTTVQKKLFCRQCGTELMAGDRFCFACGTPVQAAEPAAPAAPVVPAASAPAAPVVPAAPAPAAPEKRRPGRPRKDAGATPKAEAPRKKTIYPDVRGLYGCDLIRSVSDRAVVFTSGWTLFRVDRDMNALCREVLHPVAAAQTEEHVLVLREDEDAEKAVLCTLDDQLQTVSEQPLLDIPMEAGYDSGYSYALNGRWAVALNCTLVEDEELGTTVNRDLVIRCADLESGEVREWTQERMEVDGKQILSLNLIAGKVLLDRNFLYLDGELLDRDEDGEMNRQGASLRFDLEAGTFSLLWQGNGWRGYGKPRFFDFAHQIMWTNPREMEMKRRGWDEEAKKFQTSMLPLVPRKLAPNSPILASQPVWWFPKERALYWSYFDGANGVAYYAECYWKLQSVQQDGTLSPSWCKTPHGRTEESVVWNDCLLADLDADYYYTIYRGHPFERPKTDWMEDRLKPEKVTP